MTGSFICGYHGCMKSEPTATKTEPKFVKIGNASKPISLHPLKTGEAVAALLRVKPPVKAGK